MKFWRNNRKSVLSSSLPVRGAWVEMFWEERTKLAETRRSPCGERGLK